MKSTTPAEQQSQPGTDFILSALGAEGLDHLFMVPGGLVDAFLPALGRQTALKPIVAAHEGGAAYMADGYARASGRFGAALCIGGPGLANTVTALATAQTDGSPVLMMSGEVATALEGLGLFQDASSQTLDDVDIVKPVVRYSSSIDSPQNLAHLFNHALLQMRSPPTAPVHLSLPRDCQVGEISARHVPTDRALTAPAVLSIPAAEASLRHFLAGSNGKPPVRVAILAGGGLEHADAAKALREFAERWTIPVATTLRAKGVFPEDHALSLGNFGYAGTHHSRIALLDTPPDLLIVLGSGLNQRDTMMWSLRLAPGATIMVGLSALTIGSHAVDGGVIGDCEAYLEFLLRQTDTLQPSLGATAGERAAWLESIKAQPRWQDLENCASDAVPIHPARVIRDLRNVFPRDGILLIDSGAHRAFAGHYWESYEPRTYISATNLGPMGWAIPAAVGVQCARPERKVAVLTGDGCMNMHGLEIQTAARYHLPVLYVIINNGALGNVWLRAHNLGPVPAELTSLPDHDWAAVARALGARAETVREPAELKGAFERALSGSGPSVIDVKADKVYKTPVADWAAARATWSYQE
jgi:acetolactate synthase-1/2/3 large subunit